MFKDEFFWKVEVEEEDEYVRRVIFIRFRRIGRVKFFKIKGRKNIRKEGGSC